jgi:ABC-type glycerol-3-phosphate transport system permease component
VFYYSVCSAVCNIRRRGMAGLDIIAIKRDGRSKRIFANVRTRRRAIRFIALAVMLVYTVLTLFPFYTLFVRSFVSTKDASDLHLWIPPSEEISMEQEVGNLSVFYNLDLTDMKKAFGIPPTEFLMARMTLRDVSERYDIPEEKIKDFFSDFYTFNGWMNLLNNSLFWGAIFRTLVVTVLSVSIVIVLSIFTGYGLAGLKRKDQMAIYNIYLLQMVIPSMLILLPQYLMMQWILNLFPGYADRGLTRVVLQLATLIVINIKGTALSTMIFTSAIGAIPKELEESAKLDGSTEWQYLRYILLPLLKVPIVSLAVIQLPLIYNQFLEPYIYLDPSNSTLLPFIQSTVGQFSTNFQVIYAAMFASVIPLVLVYLMFRRMFVQGALAGAIKG